MKTNELISKKIRMALEYRGLDFHQLHNDLRKVVDIPAYELRSYVHGEEVPNSQILIGIAEVLKVNTSWMLMELDDICEMLTVRWRRENLKRDKD